MPDTPRTPSTSWLMTHATPMLSSPYLPTSGRVVWAVRRDWPIDGTHEFVCPRGSLRRALKQLARDRAFWRSGPVRPQLSVVCMSAHEFALHGRARRDCRAPDCASAADWPE